MVETGPGRGDTEKITVNLGFVDLGRIDLLVREGFYTNRTDFIRTAVRNQLAGQAADLQHSMDRRKLSVGLLRLSKTDLEAAAGAQSPLDVSVVGLAVIADDVSPDLALAGIRSLTVLGHLQASAAVRTALADRVR